MNTASTSSSRISATAPWCTTHPLTERDQAVMSQMRTLVEPNKGKLRGVAARPAFEGIIRRAAAPERVIYRADRIGGIPGWWCEPANAAIDTAIIHLHGGWFNWGTAAAFQHLVGHIAGSAGAKAFIPDYRLAPEHPFPAALDDVRACVEGIVGLGIRAVAITGDSAGGNLALSLLSTASAQSHPLNEQLVAAAVLSPVTDLTLSAKSWESRAEAEPFFVREQVESLVSAYLAGHEAADPLASPLFGSFAGLPPIRIHVGNDEVLRDDSLRFVERAVATGIDAKVDVWDGMVHGFLGSVGRLEASVAALNAIGAFLAEGLADRHHG